MALKSCVYCGRIHAKDHDCGRRPKPKNRKGRAYHRDERETGRYSYAFAVKSRDIKERSHYLCAVCLNEGRLTYKGLETHHITKLRDAPELLLEDSNLICLCRDCHKRADSGRIDRDLLKELAKQRDSSPPGISHANALAQKNHRPGGLCARNSQNEKFWDKGE